MRAHRLDLVHIEKWGRPNLKWSPLQKKIIEEQLKDLSKKKEATSYWVNTRMEWSEDLTDTGQFSETYAGEIIEDPKKMEEYKKMTEKHLEDIAEFIELWRKD